MDYREVHFCYRLQLPVVGHKVLQCLLDRFPFTLVVCLFLVYRVRYDFLRHLEYFISTSLLRQFLSTIEYLRAHNNFIVFHKVLLVDLINYVFRVVLIADNPTDHCPPLKLLTTSLIQSQFRAAHNIPFFTTCCSQKNCNKKALAESQN